eukprot:EC685803.1.p4 GENE.EC685803.1~~EC685803.1.p4  ORF type:complete len:75 (+),score=35.91 EC685803.1:246-470(+)
MLDVATASSTSGAQLLSTYRAAVESRDDTSVSRELARRFERRAARVYRSSVARAHVAEEEVDAFDEAEDMSEVA